MIDQLEFAKLSGDYNKLHVDEVAARRLLFGRPVVHGIHLVLFALEEWARSRGKPFSLVSLKVNFRKPLFVGQQVQLQIKDVSSTGIILELFRNEDLLTDINIGISDFRIGEEYLDEHIFLDETSKVVTAEGLGASEGKLDVSMENKLAQSLFPELMNFMPKIQIAELLSSTRLVGMECPGENSLFSDLNVEFKEIVSGKILIYKVLEYDLRFSKVSISIKGPSIKGVVGAFMRPSPKQQPAFSEIRTMVNPGEFSGQSALIIGGSRGLGEVVAKLLAAGGAKVLITYVKGSDDARCIQGELAGAGCSIQSIFFDVKRPEHADSAVISAFSPTHMYYFATPFIFDGIKKRFSANLFNDFADIYVHGFWRVFEAIRSFKSLRFVLYPSTAALDEFPVNMFEYTAAKATGEAMCTYIKKFFPEIEIVCPRLGRLATDQTVSLLPVNNQDPVPVMLDHLRAFKAGFNKVSRQE